uniref:Uncharacterized protein n=1 Tax=Thermogemmatispora argillosa TaxID=2045280 RepID=A0A455T169_9CHLR|nr:hypothetical protein KTA_24860 [Thermogemmatispora argillosa]
MSLFPISLSLEGNPLLTVALPTLAGNGATLSLFRACPLLRHNCFNH